MEVNWFLHDLKNFKRKKTIKKKYIFFKGDVSLTFAGQPKKSKRQERMTDPKPVIEVTQQANAKSKSTKCQSNM